MLYELTTLRRIIFTEIHFFLNKFRNDEKAKIAYIVLFFITIISSSTCIVPEKNVTYKIYLDGRVIKAKNDSTRKIEFSGTDISTVLKYVNNVISDNGVIKIVHGNYTPLSSVIFTKSVELIADGDVVFSWNKTGENLFVFKGSELSIATLNTDVSKDTNTISISNSGSAKSGDLIFVYDDAIWNPIDYPTWKSGELHEISSISGNNVIIKDNTINTFTVARSGIATLIRPITVIVDGIKINGNNNSLDYNGIQLYYTKNSIIKNGNYSNNGDHGIDITNSYNTIIENNSIGGSNMDGLGYGIVVNDASAYTTIGKNNYIYNCRHCIASGGYGRIGQPRNISIIGNVINGLGIGHVLDAHSIVESLGVYENTIYCPPEQYAIVSGAKITMIFGNTIIGGYGISTRGNFSSSGYIIDVVDNNFKNSGYIFRARQTDIANKVNISNNDIVGGNMIDGGNSLAIIYNAKFFIIANNKFVDNVTNAGDIGIYINDSINGDICNNSIYNAYLEAIYLESSNYSTVSNNVLSFYDNANENHYGISLKDSSNNYIYNNTVIRNNQNGSDVHAYGIGEFGTSDYNNIYENNLSQVGIIISNRLILSGKNSRAWNNSGYE